jgi:hypothetical protein
VMLTQGLARVGRKMSYSDSFASFEVDVLDSLLFHVFPSSWSIQSIVLLLTVYPHRYMFGKVTDTAMSESLCPLTTDIWNSASK